MELCTEANVVDHGLHSDGDNLDDFPMNQDHEFSSIVEPMFWLPISNKLILIQDYNFSNWQPPKSSSIRI